MPVPCMSHTAVNNLENLETWNHHHAFLSHLHPGHLPCLKTVHLNNNPGVGLLCASDPGHTALKPRPVDAQEVPSSFVVPCSIFSYRANVTRDHFSALYPVYADYYGRLPFRSSFQLTGFHSWSLMLMLPSPTPAQSVSLRAKSLCCEAMIFVLWAMETRLSVACTSKPWMLTFYLVLKTVRFKYK